VTEKSENSGKFFTPLLNGDRNSKERLLLPNTTDRPPFTEKINDVTKKVTQKITLQSNSFPQPAGYIKYPAYDFF